MWPFTTTQERQTDVPDLGRKRLRAKDGEGRWMGTDICCNIGRNCLDICRIGWAPNAGHNPHGHLGMDQKKVRLGEMSCLR